MKAAFPQRQLFRLNSYLDELIQRQKDPNWTIFTGRIRVYYTPINPNIYLMGERMLRLDGILTEPEIFFLCFTPEGQMHQWPDEGLTDQQLDDLIVSFIPLKAKG